MGVLCLWMLILCASCDGQPVGLVPTLTPYPTVGQVQYLDLVCPDFILPAMQSLAASYQRVNPAVIITVIQRAETLAYPMLLDAQADAVVLTWMPDSRSENVWVQPVAYDGLAVIVHPQNGVPALSQQQVQKLFQGQVENWEDFGGLPGVPQIISRENASGEFQYLQSYVMKEIRMTLNATLAPDSTYMLQMVRDDPLAAGFLSSGFLTEAVRAVPIDGIPLTMETIENRLYPLRREIAVVTMGEPVEPVRGFIQWMLSGEGQELFVRLGFVPIGG